MAERARWRRKDTKRFDKIFMALYLPLVLLHPAIAGLDAVRFHWSSMPFAFMYVGAAMFVTSLVVIGWGDLTCFRIGSRFRCMRSTPTEMQSTSENDFECLASTGVNTPVAMSPNSGCREVQLRQEPISRSRPRKSVLTQLQS